MSTVKLPPWRVIIKIAAESGVNPLTVQRVLMGRGLPMSRYVVAEAIRRLGLDIEIPSGGTAGGAAGGMAGE